MKTTPMEANNILQADVLDIIFEGRNKDYGAYNLRKTYDRRLITALVVMMGIVATIILGYVAVGNDRTTDKQEIIVDDRVLVEIKDDIIPPPPPLPPPPQPVVPIVETIQFTSPPLIVKDEDVEEADMPPPVEALEDTRIGVISQDGVKDDGIVAPPVKDEGRGIVTSPIKVEDDPIVLIVQIESSYPGGTSAWMRYLNKTFRYPEEAQTTGVFGTVVVQFIVDKEGHVSDVEAISGPAAGGLKEEAVRVIRKSGKWEPAVQNGRKVKSYKKQPIIFRLAEE